MDTKDTRKRWLAVLAQADGAALALHAEAACEGQTFEWLRRPETGLVMLRARIGRSGDRFNAGEATITRCVLRHRDAQGHATAGIGYVLGRDAQRAERVAQLDALLQQPALHDALMQLAIEPLARANDAARVQAAAQAQATRVRFFTMEPEAT